MSTARGLLRLLLCGVAACGDADGPGQVARERPIVFTGLGRSSPTGLEARTIYSVRSDGSGLTRLSPGRDQDRSPEWSPDGRRIAYVVDTMVNRTAVYQMEADGSNPRLLAFPGNRCLYQVDHVAWSPDGSRLALGCYVEIIMYDLATGAMTSLRGATEVADHPDWSPDGTRLVLAGTLDTRGGVIFTRADGTSPTPFRPSGEEPAWSPDGRRIAYTDGPTFHTAIHIANVDGSGARQVTILPDTTFRDQFPAWSPDGSRLVFQRMNNRPAAGSPAWILYVINADGSGLHRVSPDSLEATRPAW